MSFIKRPNTVHFNMMVPLAANLCPNYSNSTSIGLKILTHFSIILYVLYVFLGTRMSRSATGAGMWKMPEFPWNGGVSSFGIRHLVHRRNHWRCELSNAKWIYNGYKICTVKHSNFASFWTCALRQEIENQS